MRLLIKRRYRAFKPDQEVVLSDGVANVLIKRKVAVEIPPQRKRGRPRKED